MVKAIQFNVSLIYIFFQPFLVIDMNAVTKLASGCIGHCKADFQRLTGAETSGNLAFYIFAHSHSSPELPNNYIRKCQQFHKELH